MNYNEIYQAIPDSWENMKYHQYQKLIDIPITESGDFADFDNAFKMIQALTGADIEALEQLPLEHALVLVKRLSFTSVEPDVKNFKTKIKWKEIENITYDNFVSLITLSQDSVHNMGQIIKSFSINKLTDEEVNNLSMLEVNSAFFLLSSNVKKYIQRSTRKLSLRLIWMVIKQMITLIKRKLQKRKIN